jgi:large subunit ribosomal protein L13
MNSLNFTNGKLQNRNWFIIDCEGQKLGRLATIIVTLLKVKPHYYPSIDTGDYIILINADLIAIKAKHYIVTQEDQVIL